MTYTRKLMEEQLRSSERQFRTLAENSPGVIIRYDRECRRVYVNPAFIRESGIPAGKVLGVPLENAWIPGLTVTPEEYTALLRRAMATGAPAEMLLEWPDRNTGRILSHYVHVVAERDSDGGITGCLAISHDITRLRETELKLAKLAETSPGVLFSMLMGPDGAFRMPYASHRIRELTGLWPEEMAHDLTEAFGRIHPGDLPRFHESVRESARTLSLWHLEFRIRHPARGEIWVEGNSIPEPQGDGGILWYGFFHDISERKRSEDALQAKREQLAALTSELSLAEERERRNIAAVLHQHIGQTLLLGKIKLGTLVVERIPEHQKRLVRETMTLLEQVTREIKTLAVQLNPPILTAGGLEGALQWLGRRMEEDYGLSVEFEDDLREKPLPDKVASILYQCVRELLINVARHAGTAHARILAGRERDSYRLTVEDDGHGFDPAGLVSGVTGNCGFGLLGIKIRIERMGGSVLFDSAPGQGSRMTILAPLAISTSPACLAKRELEVLKLIADGMSTKEIAYSLNVSVKTIEVQRLKIMKKLDLHSVATLTKYAVRTGLTSAE